MTHHTLRHVLALMALTVAAAASAGIPEGYYSSLKGKTGAGLKSAVHEIIKKANVLKYGDGQGSTWWGFYSTDNDNGYVVDRYSSERRKFGSRGSSVSGMNIEHSFPKSWWGGSKNQAYQDLYNLMPSDQKANSSKSNYGMGEVVKATFDNGCIKVGKDADGQNMWQPSEQWEGDFARGYMYMVTAYQNLKWEGEALKSLTQGDYPTLKPWASKLYIKWAKADKVSTDEVARNESVYDIQGNRNPFIDFPNLMEYIWGDSIGVAFDPATTVKSGDYNPGTTDPDTPDVPEGEVVVLSSDFHGSDGGCGVETAMQPVSGTDVWTRTQAYGWKGTGSIKSGSKYTSYAADGSLVTRELDLTGMSSATLSFSHALNFCTASDGLLSVEVRCDGQTTVLDGINWPAGTDWKFVKSGDISLDQFAGKKIRIVFHYTSTASVAGTWEIESLLVTARRGTTAIDGVSAGGAFDASRPYEVYDLSGRRISAGAATGGIVIVRQDGKTRKVRR